MRIWVTGASGMLAHAIILEIRELSSTREEIELAATDVETDITKLEDVRSFTGEFKPDVIINCAAYTDVDGCESNRETAFAVNGEGPKNLAMISAELKIPLIHFSTDYVFDGTAKKAYREDSPPAPLQVYGESKLQGENFIRECTDKFYIIRTSWLYGYNGKNFVDTIVSAAAQKDELKVVSDQIGSPTFTRDLAHIIRKFLFEKPEYGIYHYTNEGSCSWYEFAKEIVRIKELNCRVAPVSTAEYKRPAARPRFSVLSKEKIKNELRIDIPHWTKALETYLK